MIQGRQEQEEQGRGSSLFSFPFSPLQQNIQIQCPLRWPSFPPVPRREPREGQSEVWDRQREIRVQTKGRATWPTQGQNRPAPEEHGASQWVGYAGQRKGRENPHGHMVGEMAVKTRCHMGKGTRKGWITRRGENVPLGKEWIFFLK